jgi:uncharacterized membrane protein
MENRGSLVAVFTDHKAAETAVKTLAAADFDIKDLSIVGKDYTIEEKVTGFYSTGDRMKFWGAEGAMWGGLWGLFFGGLFLSAPLSGGIFVLGSLATSIAAGLENAVVVGALGAIGAGLYGLGISKDSVLKYETTVNTGGFLVMAHGNDAALGRAKAILAANKPDHIAFHSGVPAAAVVPSAVPAMG